VELVFCAHDGIEVPVKRRREGVMGIIEADLVDYLVI